MWRCTSKGVYAIQARAWDDLNGMGTSAVVTINVEKYRMMDLPSSFTPQDMNNLGWVVGYDSAGGTHAAVWSNGVLTALTNVYSVAYGASDSGYISGVIGGTHGTGTLWCAGATLDLPPLPGSWTNLYPKRVNVHGQVVG